MVPLLSVSFPSLFFDHCQNSQIQRLRFFTASPSLGTLNTCSWAHRPLIPEWCCTSMVTNKSLLAKSRCLFLGLALLWLLAVFDIADHSFLLDKLPLGFFLISLFSFCYSASSMTSLPSPAFRCNFLKVTSLVFSHAHPFDYSHHRSLNLQIISTWHFQPDSSLRHHICICNLCLDGNVALIPKFNMFGMKADNKESAQNMAFEFKQTWLKILPWPLIYCVPMAKMPKLYRQL